MLKKSLIGKYCKIKDVEIDLIAEIPSDPYIFLIVGVRNKKGKDYVIITSKYFQKKLILEVPLSKVIIDPQEVCFQCRDGEYLLKVLKERDYVREYVEFGKTKFDFHCAKCGRRIKVDLTGLFK